MGAKGEDTQHVYATVRARSVENSDPSLITGITACESLETLQDILYAYYHIGDIRNKINHAESSAMAENRLVVSESDDPAALVRVKESIDFFISSYEKAMSEVQDKKPNVVIITGDDVRIASEHMRREKHS